MIRRCHLVLVGLAVALAGCGADASSSEKPSVGSLSAQIDPDGAKGAVPPRSNEVSVAATASSAVVSTPCKLISRAQVAAIAREPILKPVQAPQGPTCIYPYKSGKRPITLAVQSLDVKALKQQVGRAKSVRVTDRTGLCGDRGQPMLYVPISRSQVLTIAAPCNLAAGFAARALQRLGG